jgi:hypothetical protein
MTDPRQPTEDVDRLNIELKALADRLSSLESPSGTQRVAAAARLQKTVDYLASLHTASQNGGSVPDFPVPRDDNWHYQATTAVVTGFTVPTGHAIVRAACQRVGIVTAGSYVEGGVGLEIRDANGNVPNGFGKEATLARLWTDRAMALSLVTPDYHFAPDPVANPGPYTITAYVAGWAAPANTSAIDIDFDVSTVYAGVFGYGVPA